MLSASFYLDGLLYEGKFMKTTSVSHEVIVSEINSKHYSMEIKGKEVELKFLNGIFSIKFHHCCGRKWLVVGKFNDIPKIFTAYPVTEYEFGVIYNGPTVMPVIINQWNIGYRITTRDLFPWGDDGNSMAPVHAMWTKGTNDVESKGENWCHRYVDHMYKAFLSNGPMNLELYARKM